MKVWQIATGEPGRDYHEIFFDHDVMIIGPSDKGNALKNNYDDNVPNSAGNQVDNFAKKPSPGDRVIMRFARKVLGVGQVPFELAQHYTFVEAFRCVYGWDLCHCHRVIWAEQYELGELADVYQNTMQKPSFTQVHEDHIVEMVQSIDDSVFDRPLKSMPQIDASLYTDEELGIALFRAGISNKNSNDILQALNQAARLCSWYESDDDCGRKPSENEVVSHVLLPLFLGLGWSHQQIAVEWNKVDMVFFNSTPTTPENCVMVLEAKGLGTPLGDILQQPKEYIDDLNLDNTKDILTSNGNNLFVYERTNGGWHTNPIGYMNMKSLQKQYILPKGVDLVDTLVMLQPNVV